MDKKELLTIAREVKKNAYAPYSKFPVGAALLAKDGRVFTGVNIENTSYGLTICAERAAVASAITAGAREFTMLALSTDADEIIPPCGACLQVLAEFGGDLLLILDHKNSDPQEVYLKDLLPMTFRKPKGE